MAAKAKRFVVDTQPSKALVVSGITRDASVETCVFDLIDNSIDAARDTLRQAAPPEVKGVLPDSYDGFTITLTMDGEGLKLEDNCGGIPIAKLKSMVLTFGKPSTHEMGIGAFGIGLNRAIFRLGRVSHLKTDTGKQRAELVLETDVYLATEGWDLPAEEFSSTGKIGTELEIRKAPVEIAQQMADRAWVDKLRHELGRRYGRFIAKKLSIRIIATITTTSHARARNDISQDINLSLIQSCQTPPLPPSTA